mgnify:CR=1 FL=1
MDTGTAYGRKPGTHRSELTEVGAGVHQRCQGHVAGSASEAVEPRGAAHGHIRATAHAAPNPLSMPTTVTPLAHEACMANNAVTPSNPEP